MYRLAEAASSAQFAAARVLIEEYAAQIGPQMHVDLGFQNFAAELKQLPKMYGPPSGCLILASRDDRWVGCCAVRRFDDDACEMKRLYVRPSARGANLGYRLAQSVMVKARTLGYRETEPYYFNPVAGVTYMELILPAT